MVTTALPYIKCMLMIILIFVHVPEIFPVLLLSLLYWYSGIQYLAQGCVSMCYGVTSLPAVATFYCSQTAALIILLCFSMINLVYFCVARLRVIRGYCRLALAVLCTSTIYSNISTFICGSSTGNGRSKNEIGLILRNEVRWCMIYTCMWHTDVRGVGLTYRNDRI